jgi:hypothetical protein
MVASSSLSYWAYKEGAPEVRAIIRQSIEEKRFRAVCFGFNNYTRRLKLMLFPEKVKCLSGQQSRCRISAPHPMDQYMRKGMSAVSNEEKVWNSVCPASTVYEKL